MNTIRKGNKELIKNLNRTIVMNEIRINGPINRTEISKRTELGLSTITNIVDELLGEKLIYEIGEGISSGGRKPVLLQFNENAGIVVGIKIEKKQLITCVSNLEAKVLHKSYANFTRDYSNDDIIHLMKQEIESVLNHFDSKLELCGIGIATSGLVDRKNKKMIHSPILSWDDFEFGFLEEYFKVPLFIDNDANVFSLAQMWIGMGKEYNNFIGVTIGSGVGAGIVINKQLYIGEYGGAGEFGHIVIQREGSPCHCGQRGCLEMYASDDYIISEAMRLVELGQPTKLLDYEEITTEAIYECAKDGDVYSQDILIKQGENLGIGLKNMVNLFNPGAIILGGEGLRGSSYLVKGIEKELSTHFFTKHHDIRLHLTDMEDDIWLIGACALVLHDLYKAPIYKNS